MDPDRKLFLEHEDAHTQKLVNKGFRPSTFETLAPISQIVPRLGFPVLSQRDQVTLELI